jgi:hypothetical protein
MHPLTMAGFLMEAAPVEALGAAFYRGSRPIQWPSSEGLSAVLVAVRPLLQAPLETPPKRHRLVWPLDLDSPVE